MPIDKMIVLKSWEWGDVTEIGLFTSSTEALDYPTYEEAVGFIQTMESASQWALGDAYILGSMRFRKVELKSGEPCSRECIEKADIDGDGVEIYMPCQICGRKGAVGDIEISLDPTQAFSFRKGQIKTLQNYAWVCRRYKFSQRVRGVSFSHHAIVAKLSHERRLYWLARTIAEDLSTDELTELTRKERNIADRSGSSIFGGIIEYYNEILKLYQRLPDFPEKSILRHALKVMEEAINTIEKGRGKKRSVA